jgi:hypothetical protein
MSGETGNLVVKVDVKENLEEGPFMANSKLLEAWVSSGKANQVTRVSQTCLSYPKISGSDQGYLKVTVRVGRLGEIRVSRSSKTG